MTSEPLPEEDGAASSPQGEALSPAAAGPTSEERSRSRGRNRGSLEENREDGIARQLRGFGPLGILAIVIVLSGNYVFTPLSAILALAWARLSQTPWRDLGFVRPHSWPRTIVIGIVFGVALKFAMKSIVMPLFGAPPVNQAFHFLAGNTAAIPWMLYIIIVGAGFGEEVIFRGWAFERLGKIFGSAGWAKAFIVVLTSAWFGYEHYSFQGMPGVQQAVIVGLTFGSIFAVTRRIVPLMIAHAAFDLAALAMIYWDFETAVARFFFK